MAGYRKLGRTSNQRKAMIRSQVTALLYHGHIKTTETRAKEIRKVAEGLIALAVKEKDNFETVKVTAKVARKDANGKRVKEVVDGKKVTVYDEVEKEIKKDSASRLHARRQMLKVLYGVTEVPTQAAGKKNGTKSVDLVAKLFDEVAPKYVSRNGGYTRIVKIGQRKGDAAMEVLLELDESLTYIDLNIVMQATAGTVKGICSLFFADFVSDAVFRQRFERIS